jgi:hypothetical protein
MGNFFSFFALLHNKKLGSTLVCFYNFQIFLKLANQSTKIIVLITMLVYVRMGGLVRECAVEIKLKSLLKLFNNY